MADLPTRLDLFQLGRQYVLSRATRIDPSVIDTEGSDANLFIGSQSVVAFSLVQQLGDRTAALLLDSAEDEDLDRYGWDRYRLPRKGAAAAVGQVRFFRASASVGAGAIPVGTKLSTLTRSEYITTTQATFGASQLEATALVRAVRAGKAHQVGRNQIRRIQGTIFDSTIQVTNDDPTAGGEPREGNDDYRLRIRNYWLNAQRGTLSAIAFGATTVPGVVTADAVEAVNPNDAFPARVVELFIADSSGVASQALGAAVSQALLEWRAGGIATVIATSLPQIVDVRLKLAFLATADTASLTELVRATVVGYVNSLGVNQPLYRNSLGSLLRRFQPSGLLPENSSVIEPTGDIYPAAGRTLRTRPENVIVE